MGTRMLSRKHSERTDAIARAAKLWGACALEARAALRKQGVAGDLPRLDEYASGRRGSSVPTGLAMFARELKDKGVPRDQTEARVAYAVQQIVRVIYQDEPLRAA